MKLEIVKMTTPGAPNGADLKPTLLYGPMIFREGEFWHLAFPIATESIEPYGQTWLSENSPAFKSTGLTVGGVLQIADTFRFRAFSETPELVKRTGHWLNLVKDPELSDRFAIAAQEAGEALSDFEAIPVAF